MRQDGLDPARVARVDAGLAMRTDGAVDALCAGAARVLGVSGAGVILVSGGQTLTNVCVSDPIAEAVEEAQYTLGEGPCVEAYHGRAPVLVPDLANAPNVRWTEFCERAGELGVRAAFGFPLMIETVCLGASICTNHKPVRSLTTSFPMPSSSRTSRAVPSSAGNQSQGRSRWRGSSNGFRNTAP